MITPRRLLAWVLSLGVALGLGLTGVTPASGTVTTLCKGYSGCARAGMSDAGYGAANRTMYWRMYAGHNCTNYAAYRMIKAGASTSRPWSGSGNATNWGVAMSKITDSTPTAGSIAWWRAGVKPAGSAGHVAYVERVVSADEIIVSQDSWGGDFSWARVTRASSGWPSGFIHFLGSDTPTPPKPKPTPTPTPDPEPEPEPEQPSTPPVPEVSAPTLRGAAKPEQTLEVVLPSAPKGLTSSVQWLRDGSPIAKATARTYLIGAADVGSRLRAEVRYTGANYSPRVTSSPPTKRVRVPATVDVSTTPGKRRFSFRAEVTGYRGAPVDGTLQVRRNHRMLRSFPIRDGVAQGTVGKLRPRTATYRFRAQITLATTRGQTTARIPVHR